MNTSEIKNRLDLAELLVVAGHSGVSKELFKQHNVNIKLLNRHSVGVEYDTLVSLLKTRFIPEWLPMQAELDLSMAGEDAYKTLVSKNGKKINYGYCLASERNELQDCMPWKHWKDIDAKTDMDNIKTELIDKMHFLPAIINVLVEAMIDKDDGKNNAIKELLVTIEEVNWMERNETRFLESMVGTRRLMAFKEERGIEKEAEDIIVKYMLTVSELDLEFIGFFHAAHSLKKIDSENFITFRDVIAAIENEGAGQIKAKAVLIAQLAHYIATVIYTYAIIFDMSIEEAYEDMWKKYLIKNVLNLYRINNGYKEGTYIKMFDGVEDNTIINEIAAILELEDRPLIKDELYSAYDARYKELYKIEKDRISKVVNQNNGKIYPAVDKN